MIEERELVNPAMPELIRRSLAVIDSSANSEGGVAAGDRNRTALGESNLDSVEIQPQLFSIRDKGKMVPTVQRKRLEV